MKCMFWENVMLRERRGPEERTPQAEKTVRVEMSKWRVVLGSMS